MTTLVLVISVGVIYLTSTYCQGKNGVPLTTSVFKHVDEDIRLDCTSSLHTNIDLIWSINFCKPQNENVEKKLSKEYPRDSSPSFPKVVPTGSTRTWASPKVSLSTAGVVTCSRLTSIAADKKGHMLHQMHYLVSVAESPHMILPHLEPLSEVNTTLTFTCEAKYRLASQTIIHPKLQCKLGGGYIGGTDSLSTSDQVNCSGKGVVIAEFTLTVNCSVMINSDDHLKDLKCELLQPNSNIVWTESMSHSLRVKGPPTSLKIVCHPKAPWYLGEDVSCTCAGSNDGRPHPPKIELSLSPHLATGYMPLVIRFDANKRHTGREMTCVSTVERSTQDSFIVDVLYGPATVAVDVYVRRLNQSLAPLVVQGDHVVLTCKPSPANPNVSRYEWIIDGHVLTNENGATLTMGTVSRKHTGKYTCMAINTAGATLSDEEAMEVNYKPEMRSPQREFWRSKGGTVTFESLVDSYPPPTGFHWSIGNTPIPAHVRQANYEIQNSGYSSSLTVTDIESKHFAKYTCEVTHKLGLSTLSFELKHTDEAGKPQDLSLKKVSVNFVVLSWKSGIESSVQTFSVFQKLKSDKMFTPVDINVTNDVSGEYTCVVDNLLSGREYIVKVRAWNDIHQGNFSETTLDLKLTEMEHIPSLYQAIIHDGIAVVYWDDLPSGIDVTNVEIKYCKQPGIECDWKRVDPDTHALTAKLDEGYSYSFQLLLYDGDHVIMSSDSLTVAAKDNLTGSIVATIIVTVVINSLLLALIVWSWRRFHQKTTVKADVYDDESNAFKRGDLQGFRPSSVQCSSPVNADVGFEKVHEQSVLLAGPSHSTNNPGSSFVTNKE